MTIGISEQLKKFCSKEILQGTSLNLEDFKLGESVDAIPCTDNPVWLGYQDEVEK